MSTETQPVDGNGENMPVSGSGLPIHASNNDNTYTLCGLKINKEMSYHRDGIMLGMIMGGVKYACGECLSHHPDTGKMVKNNL